jgi:undecaprenyl diphosphate synthase
MGRVQREIGPRFDNPLRKKYNFPMSDTFKGFFKKESAEYVLWKEIDLQKLPVHVAIIMDGNGRWALQRDLNRAKGHVRGAEIAREITECAARLGIKHLTLFTFSTENWKRPQREIRFLMKMLYDNLAAEKETLGKNEVRLMAIGDLSGLPARLREKLLQISELTRGNRRMQLNLALNYGGRMDIVTAVQRMAREHIDLSRLDSETFSRYLYTAGSPDPDLLIRTSGEFRISNFLLFQIAYSELYFTRTLWPDFGTGEFFKAILEFQSRQRRYGNI